MTLGLFKITDYRTHNNTGPREETVQVEFTPINGYDDASITRILPKVVVQTLQTGDVVRLAIEKIE